MNLRPLLCLLPLTAFAACAGGRAGVRDGGAAPEIELAGNRAFDAATLREAVHSTPCDARHALHAAIMTAPEARDPAPCKSAEDVADTLAFFYLDRGYLGAKVKAAGGQKAGRLRFVVDEGERFRLGALDVVETGARPADPAVGDPQGLAALLSLRTGEPFSGSRVRAAIETLRGRYVAAGYPEANVTPHTSISLDAFQIDLRVEIERGARRAGPL